MKYINKYIYINKMNESIAKYENIKRLLIARFNLQNISLNGKGSWTCSFSLRQSKYIRLYWLYLN
jgi:hypothetical protein